MEVLDAIMKILSDMFSINGIPAGTAGAIVGGLGGFFGAIWKVIEFFRMLFGMFQGAAV